MPADLPEGGGVAAKCPGDQARPKALFPAYRTPEAIGWRG